MTAGAAVEAARKAMGATAAGSAAALTRLYALMLGLDGEDDAAQVLHAEADKYDAAWFRAMVEDRP